MPRYQPPSDTTGPIFPNLVLVGWVWLFWSSGEDLASDHAANAATNALVGGSPFSIRSIETTPDGAWFRICHF
jgi:hypothetical protein